MSRANRGRGHPVRCLPSVRNAPLPAGFRPAPGPYRRRPVPADRRRHRTTPVPGTSLAPYPVVSASTPRRRLVPVGSMPPDTANDTVVRRTLSTPARRRR
ncbi:hypothetical protein GOAMI_60_00140 [Gordonia amicalis NBRC 100051 = JCM 11271]|nr:hypothetical protein GOAMI_60_00140 [Gordonia amicalis NBRC 100051 = JCM 11271]